MEPPTPIQKETKVRSTNYWEYNNLVHYVGRTSVNGLPDYSLGRTGQMRFAVVKGCGSYSLASMGVVVYWRNAIIIADPFYSGDITYMYL